MAVAAVAVTHPPITMVLRFTTHAFRKFLVTGTVLVSLAAPALAIDAYDGATGQLTIPVVRAYGNLYRDVVVEIGEVVSVFKRAANGVWSDATARFVGDQQANTTLADGWCYKLEVEDLNNDGIPDVICQSTRGLGTPTNNVFWWGGPTLRASGITLQNGDWTNFQTVVKNRDGFYLLGLRNRKGESLLSVQRWKIR